MGRKWNKKKRETTTNWDKELSKKTIIDPYLKKEPRRGRNQRVQNPPKEASQ